MAVPTIRMRQFDLSESDANIDSAAKRKGALSGDAVVNTGNPPSGGSPLIFGVVDISGGQADSNIIPCRLDFTADGGNTLVEDFELFLLAADNGFSGGSTVVNMTEEGISSSTEGAGTFTQLWDDTAPNKASYVWTALNSTEQSARNLRPADDGTSMVLSTSSDDAIIWLNYVQVDAAEVTGTYEAASSGKEFRYSLTHSYS